MKVALAFITPYSVRAQQKMAMTTKPAVTDKKLIKGLMPCEQIKLEYTFISQLTLLKYEIETIPFNF